jgi:hypothetical protein
MRSLVAADSNWAFPAASVFVGGVEQKDVGFNMLQGEMQKTHVECRW